MTLQMFQRLCIHVIQRLRPVHAHLYLQPGLEDWYILIPSISNIYFVKLIYRMPVLYSYIGEHLHWSFISDNIFCYCVIRK